MDQVKIGKFISSVRKDKKLTQRQLAGILSVSDKTISKWECGKGLPEVSLMLPLCKTLSITVNDLLSGERISDANYYMKDEENMIDLMMENEENKKRLALSVICGVITIIAACSLVVIASYIEMPTIVRIILIIFAITTSVVGIGVACLLDVKAGYFECPHCGSLFVPATSDNIKAYHTFTKRRLTCPTCGKIGVCRKRITR